MELPEDIQACLLGPELLAEDTLFGEDWEPEPRREPGDLVDGRSWTTTLVAPVTQLELLPRLTSMESASTGVQQPPQQQAHPGAGGLWPGAELTAAGAAATFEACLPGPAWLLGDSGASGHSAQGLPGFSLEPLPSFAAAMPAPAAAAVGYDDAARVGSGAACAPAPSAAQQPCESCWESMLSRLAGDALHERLRDGGMGTEMAKAAADVLSRAVWGCERVEAASSSGSSSSSSGGDSNLRPCLIDGQLQQGKDWQISWTKARDAPPGQQRAPDGTEWARDYNIAVNAPQSVPCSFGPGASGSEGGSSNSGSGSDNSRQLYCIHARSGALTAYTLAQQVGGGVDAADSSEDSVWSYCFTCRKQNSPLFDQQLQPLKYAFISKDSSKGDSSSSQPKKKKQKKD